MKFTPTLNLGPTTTITRQTLYDLWSTASPGDIVESDLDWGLGERLPVTVASEATSVPFPGQVWFDRTEQLWKVFVDVLEGTGVSVWIAFGPDRFDEPMLARETIPPYAVVFHGTDVRRGAVLGKSCNSEHDLFMGVNALAQTVASGAWFPVAVEGICFGGTISGPSEASYQPYRYHHSVSENVVPQWAKESYKRDGGLTFQRPDAKPMDAPPSVVWVGLGLGYEADSNTLNVTRRMSIMLVPGGRRAAENTMGTKNVSGS